MCERFDVVNKQLINICTEITLFFSESQCQYLTFSDCVWLCHCCDFFLHPDTKTHAWTLWLWDGVVFSPYICCCFYRKVAFVKTTPVHLFCYEVIISQNYEQRWIMLVILITPWNETMSWFICEWHIHNNRQEELSLTSLDTVIHCTTMDRTVHFVLHTIYTG